MEKIRPTFLEKIQQTGEAILPQSLVRRWRNLSHFAKETIYFVGAITGFAITAFGVTNGRHEVLLSLASLTALGVCGMKMIQESNKIQSDRQRQLDEQAEIEILEDQKSALKNHEDALINKDWLTL